MSHSLPPVGASPFASARDPRKAWRRVCLSLLAGLLAASAGGCSDEQEDSGAVILVGEGGQTSQGGSSGKGGNSGTAGKGGASSTAGTGGTAAGASGAAGAKAGQGGASAGQGGAAPGGGGGMSGASGGEAGGPACSNVYAKCAGSADCCAGLSCGNTTAGDSICCGNAGTSCATADGADCCGSLLCVDGKCAEYTCSGVYTKCSDSADCCAGLSCGNTTAGSSICCGNVGTSCATADGADCCGSLLCVNGKCAEDTCSNVYAKCTDSVDCCGGLSCGKTTAGDSICCGNAGTSCATADGADCCGSLLCVNGKCSTGSGPLNFKAPFPCGQSWTYSHHSKEVRRALDFVNSNGGTNGMPVLASEAGVATRHYQAGGAGNYIVVTHGGGWKTYYFHLSSYSVPDGATVKQGQEVGKVGSTGASSGPHLHYEQLLNGVGKDIVIDGKALTPYPGSYGQKSLTSTNCN